MKVKEKRSRNKINKLESGEFKYIPFYLSAENIDRIKQLRVKLNITYNEIFSKLLKGK